MVINIANDQPSSQIEKCKFLYLLCSFYLLIHIQAIDDITHDHKFMDLYKFQLSDQDWKLLADYQEILQVNVYLS